MGSFAACHVQSGLELLHSESPCFELMCYVVRTWVHILFTPVAHDQQLHAHFCTALRGAAAEIPKGIGWPSSWRRPAYVCHTMNHVYNMYVCTYVRTYILPWTMNEWQSALSLYFLLLAVGGVRLHPWHMYVRMYMYIYWTVVCPI